MDDLAERVKADFGTVDALVVNAGITGFAPFASTSEEMYEDLMRVNAKGPYFTVQKLAAAVGGKRRGLHHLSLERNWLPDGQRLFQ